MIFRLNLILIQRRFNTTTVFKKTVFFPSRMSRMQYLIVGLQKPKWYLNKSRFTVKWNRLWQLSLRSATISTTYKGTCDSHYNRYFCKTCSARIWAWVDAVVELYDLSVHFVVLALLVVRRCFLMFYNV